MNLHRPKYRPDIDGLRAVAVLAVVGFHAFPAFVPGGFIGVDVFFVISGFLISTIIFENLAAGTFTFADFYARRVRRVFPALGLLLIACYVIGWFALLADEFTQLGKHIAASAAFVQNLVLWRESGYFDNAAETKPLLHIWSLAVEEQFYLVWPLILWLSWRRKMRVWVVIAVIALASFALSVYGVRQDPVGAFYSPLARFWELLSGSLLAWVAVFRRRERAPEHASPGGNVLSTLGLCLLAFGIWRISRDSAFPGAWALVPVAGAVMIVSAQSSSWVNRRILGNRVLVWVGLISYPLYLWHWSLLSFARIVDGRVPETRVRAALVVLAIALAWITYRLLERPVRFGPHGTLKAATLVAVMAVVGVVGARTYALDGFSFRVKTFATSSARQLERNSIQLQYTFPNTDACHAAHPYASSSCYQSERKHEQSIYLVGDSHLEALVHGFKTLFDSGELAYNVTAIGMPGCNPFLNVETLTGSGGVFGCRRIMTPALEEAMRRRDVTWVVLAGRHASRYRGTSFGFNGESFAELPLDEKQLHYRYENASLTSTDYSDVFVRGLADTLDALAKSGKRVVFVDQMPELGFDPRACVAGFRQVFSDSKCRLPRSAVDARLAPYKNASRPIIGRFTNVVEYDPIGLVCDARECGPFDASGDLMYRDDNHMSMFAAESIARNIAGILEGETR